LLIKQKLTRLPGTSYAEVYRSARGVYKDISRRTKRKPYVRSAYFKKDKIFFDFFWRHLCEKTPRDRFRRLKYFAAAVEVIRSSRNKPTSKSNPNKSTEILYRFTGKTKGGSLFVVQIKENKRSGKGYFMSCFSSK